MARLLVIDGPWKGLELSLSEGKAHVLGRGDTASFAIPDRALSREHCRIEHADGVWSVEDLKSRNGISVNGERVERAQLRGGDLFAIGQSVMRFADDDAPALMADPEQMTATMQIAPVPGDRRAGPSWKEEHYVALLDLGDRLLRASATEELELVVASWLLAETKGARALLFHRRGDRLVDAGIVDASGKKQQSVTVTLPAPVLLAARDGQCIWIDPDPSDSGGRFLAPLLAPSHIVLLVEGIEEVPTQEALRLYASGVDLAAATLARIRHLEALETRVESLEAQPSQPGLIAESAAMQGVVSFVERVASVDTTVLILGDSGTGKELVARTIHAESPRRAGPFVAVNCGALPESLMESELFGHEKGAFTGAQSRRVGRFERADRGTLFLDEIGDLSLPAQARLLRALEEKVIERVGGSGPVEVDARIVAATNRDLREMVEHEKFREDLYYRLSVVVAELPPLADRTEDIRPLAEHFVRQIAPRIGRAVTGLSAEACVALEQYDWPGNVRELRNVIERALILGKDDQITERDISLIERPKTKIGEGLLVELPLPLAELERRAVQAAMSATDGNKSKAARLLGIDRATLYARLREYSSS